MDFPRFSEVCTGLYCYNVVGMSANWARNLVYSSVRLGIYPIFKNIISKPNEQFLPLYKKILCGTLSGGVGSFIGSPTDLVLIRMGTGSYKYRNVFHGFYETVKNDGIFGLWRGCVPTVVRGMIMNGAQIASYDQVKQLMLTKTKFFKDNFFTHIFASFIAGIITTTAGSPVDVIKTRVMHQNVDPKTGELPYKGMIDATIKTWKSEGLRGFYKGYIPNASRLVPVTILVFVFYEKIFMLYKRALYHDQYLKEKKKS